MPYQFLTTRREGSVEYLTLNRPDVRNAFNDELIAELADWTVRIKQEGGRDGVRVAVLAGAGKAFCAGADLAWMAKAVHFTEDDNVRDAMAAARMFSALDTLPVPLVARVHGAAIGGGAGLAAVCDVVVAEDETVFGFTEVKLGILPAVISPFVVAKIGRSAARELFLTGTRFPAVRAREVGLVHAMVPSNDLDRTVAHYVQELLTAGPEAVASAKALIAQVWALPVQETASITARAIAARRVSAEGQEGLTAFLQKRKPSWSA